MNALMNVTNEVTMTSLEIAELVESRHADVTRTIERLMNSGVIVGSAPSAYTHPQNGQQYKKYDLCKRDSYVVVAQLSPEFTARLVDRWQELESKASVPALPQTYLEALEALVASEKEKEVLKIAVQEAAPKVEYYEKIVGNTTDLLTVTEIAVKLGISPQKLNLFLERSGAYDMRLTKGSKRVLRAKFIEQGYGVMKKETANNKVYERALFTQAGEARIIEKYNQEKDL